MAGLANTSALTCRDRECNKNKTHVDVWTSLSAKRQQPKKRILRKIHSTACDSSAMCTWNDSRFSDSALRWCRVLSAFDKQTHTRARSHMVMTEWDGSSTVLIHPTYASHRAYTLFKYHTYIYILCTQCRHNNALVFPMLLSLSPMLIASFPSHSALICLTFAYGCDRQRT